MIPVYVVLSVFSTVLCSLLSLDLHYVTSYSISSEVYPLAVLAFIQIMKMRVCLLLCACAFQVLLFLYILG